MDVHVVMASDEGFLVPTVVALQSMMSASHKENTYLVHVISPWGYSFAEEPLVRSLVGRWPNLCVDQLNVPREVQRVFEEASAASCLTASTYYRLLVDQLLPDVHTCVYLDGDVLVYDDVAALYQQDLRGCSIGAVRDPICGLKGSFAQMHQRKLGFAYEGRYFCAGVMKLDLDRIRESGIFAELVRPHACDLPFFDQDELNRAFRDDVQLLPLRFDVFARELAEGQLRSRGCYDEEELAAVEAGDICVLHYAGQANKPWDCVWQRDSTAWWDVARDILPPDVLASVEERSLSTWRSLAPAALLQACVASESVVIYGQTPAGRACADLLDAYGVTPRCFMDRNSRVQGTSYRGITCCDPDEVTLDDGQTVVVLAAQKAYKELAKVLAERGFPAERTYRYLHRDAPYYTSLPQGLRAEELAMVRVALRMLPDARGAAWEALSDEQLWARLAEGFVPLLQGGGAHA